MKRIGKKKKKKKERQELHCPRLFGAPAGLVASGTRLIGTTDSQPISGSAVEQGTKAPSSPLPMTAHARP